MAFTKSSPQYFDTGSTFSGKDGSQQRMQLCYQTYAPTDSKASKRIPIVLVGGWTSVKEDWAEFADGLAAQRPVLVFDNRGMGESSKPSGPYTMQQLANDAIDIGVHVYGDRKLHYMGISMGGMIVQTIATLRPQLLQTLTIGCSHSSARHAIRHPDSGAFVASMPKGPVPKDQIRKVVETTRRFQYTEEWIKQHPEEFQRGVDVSMQYKRPTKSADSQFAAIAKYDVRDAIQKLNTKEVPTLVLHGDGDRVIDVRNGRNVHAAIKGSAYHELSGIGHHFWTQGKDEALKHVSEFVQRHDSRQSKL